ncbi:alpha/beta fold hydrolase [Hahella ganghwensis]|uniref:alpha/beta fold hydrolase n=1 Tax=Hahella ganghwensis TaxID=286420 RepID=UPI00037A8FA1|nr:alpha/beta hydrolase [Hahella ganghwensis]
MPYASSGKVRIFYETRGQGMPLLMIMGWLANRVWWPESLLASLEPHVQMILVDNRGAGNSSDTAGIYTMADLAQDAMAVLDDLGLEKAHVLGVSMGGMVAQEIALRYSERVRHLILLSTSASPISLRHITRSQQQFWLKSLLRRDRSLKERQLDLMFSREEDESLSSDIETFARRIASLPNPKVTHLKQYLAIMGFNSRSRLAQLACPTLVATGTNDMILSHHHSHDLYRHIPNAQLYEVPDGSHAMLGAGDELARTFVEFMGLR